MLLKEKILSFFKKEKNDIKNYTKTYNTKEITTFIKNELKNEDKGYNFLLKLSSSLEEINNNFNYSKLISIFNKHLKKIEREWDDSYRNENLAADIALSEVFSILANSKDGYSSVKWTMNHYYGDAVTEKFKAYHMDSETWELLKLYIEDTKGNEEGYIFKCTLDPEIEKIEYPCCICEIVSSNDTISGNHISSDCDTYGTSYGSKAKGLYAFYITDLKVFAIVESSYWVF